MSIHLSYWDTPGSPQKEGKKMTNKVTADQKLAFVNKIIGSDVFNSSDVAAVAILQQLIDSAKKEIATQNVEKLDKQLRQEGKTIANKTKIVKMAIAQLNFDSDTVFGAYARELGVKL
jgi:hypothetical protein